MKIRCDKEILMRRLMAAARAVGSRPNLDVLNGLHIVAKDGAVTVTGSNLDMTIRATFSSSVGVEEEGEVVLQARRLTATVRSLAGDEVTISTDEEKVVVSGGNATFKMSSYPAAEFPRVGLDLEGDEVMVDADALMTGISQVAGAASDDHARPILTGVLFEEHEGSLRLVATDSYRLALCDLPGVGVLAKGQKVIVPADAVDTLTKVMDNSGDDEKVTVQLAERDISFKIDDGAGTIQIVTRLIEGDFPKYESLIPAESPRTLKVKKLEISEVIRRIRQIAPEPDKPVRMSQREGGVDLLVKAPEIGDTAEESVKGDYKGDPLTIAFNPEYLLAGLDAIASEQVKLDSDDELKPAVLRPEGKSDFLYLMMPVRIT